MPLHFRTHNHFHRTNPISFFILVLSPTTPNTPKKKNPKSITMAKTKKSGDTLASRLALVMKSGKGEFLDPSPKNGLNIELTYNLQLPWVPSPP